MLTEAATKAGTSTILRPYQAAALARLSRLTAHGYRSVLLAAPCGSGKTVIGCEAIRRQVEAGGRAVFVAPRRELIDQAADKLDALGLTYGVLMADDPRSDPRAPVQLASIDTLHSRLRRCGTVPIADPGLVVVDECHMYRHPAPGRPSQPVAERVAGRAHRYPRAEGRPWPSGPIRRPDRSCNRA